MHTDEPPTYIHTNAIYKTLKDLKFIFKIMVDSIQEYFIIKVRKPEMTQSRISVDRAYEQDTLSLLKLLKEIKIFFKG